MLPQQTEFFLEETPTNQTPLENLSNQELQKLALLPKHGNCYPRTEKETLRDWLKANQILRDRAHKTSQRDFASKGWPYSWFLHEWTPASQNEEDTLEAFLHTVEKSYPPIYKRGITNSEDMGILQSSSFGATEGILAKKQAYGNLILLQITTTTGPLNWDPHEKTVQFEPGAKSHRIFLAYQELPTPHTLEGDIAAFPLLSQPLNHLGLTYRSEGFTGELYNKGVPLHKPWNTLKPEEIHNLKNTYRETSRQNKKLAA